MGCGTTSKKQVSRVFGNDCKDWPVPVCLRGERLLTISLFVVIYYTSDLYHDGTQLAFGRLLPFFWHFLWAIVGFEVKPESEGDGFTLVSLAIQECKLGFDVFLEQIIIPGGI